MIPLRLQLRNFMCYGENVAPLVLDGVHVVCLSGDNGHGKSALLDAMTWALWGRARAKSDDELVQMGKTEMEVEFEFAVGGTRYRVIRKRALKRKRGLPALEFQILGDTGYRPITGNSVHETQRKISTALRMEYETFINSALLLQGRADEFTVKPPAERKKVLGDVLGLGVYDDLEARAREMARNAEQSRRELAATLGDIERELERRPEYEAERERVADGLKAAEAEVAALEVALRQVLDKKKELEDKRARADDLRERRERERRQLAALESQIAADRADLAANEAVLARRETVEAGYGRLLVLRERDGELSRKATQTLAMAERKASLEQAIAQARSALESEGRVPAMAVASAKKKAEQRPALERDLAAVQQKLERLVALERQRDDLRESIQSCQTQVELLKATNEQLRHDMSQLKQKLELLAGDGATCPLCESELGPAERRNLMVKFDAEGRQFGADYRANAARAKELEAHAARAQHDLLGIEQQLRDREQLRRQAGVLERSLLEIEEAVREAESARRLLADLHARLVRGDFAMPEQMELAAVQAEIAALGYDAEEHERVRQEAADLADYERLLGDVQRAETAVGLLSEKVRQNEEAIAQRRQMLGDLDAMLAALEQELAQGARVLVEVALAGDRLDAAGKRAADLRQELGRAEQLVSHCQYLEGQRREKTAAMQQAAEEKSIYDDLALAFGKKGIQAMIIDSALPEIEDEANLLLARLTDNRMHVKLETQREAKSGDGLIETLDIKIADELGYRQYEMYSGGEAFRVNFAIRIALSKLLARRAGARLQTLIVDEGFGTQDASGRERLVEAINSVSEDFDCIVAITHIQELKDAFPTRIEIVKGAEGSQIIMTG